MPTNPNLSGNFVRDWNLSSPISNLFLIFLPELIYRWTCVLNNYLTRSLCKNVQFEVYWVITPGRLFYVYFPNKLEFTVMIDAPPTSVGAVLERDGHSVLSIFW